MKITFLGAVEEVTGSKYLLEHKDTKILVDCGLFQGSYKATQRNRDEFPVDPAAINAVVLTHAHIDHSGYVPLLVKKGFKGKIYCSQATYELCEILLLDNGNIQEVAAKDFNAQKDPGTPAILPLYTKADAQFSLGFFQVVDYETPFTIGAFTISLIRCSHIIGSSFVVVSDGKSKLTFSGDMGGQQLIMKTPTLLKRTDYLVLESTYGDRLHAEGDPIGMLGKIINETVARGGKVLIPAFAVGRTQTILYCLYQLKQNNIIADIPIFLDSPMAISVSDLFCNFKEDYTLPVEKCKEILSIAKNIHTVEESKQLDDLNGSAIIIAGSGMMEGGRMVHHLHYVSDPKNTLIMVGYQPAGTRGGYLRSGAHEIKLFGRTYAVRAHIETLDMFSAHADYEEILKWLAHFQQGPKKIFLTHGDHESATSLKQKIEQRFGWQVIVPTYQESFDLD